MGLGFHLCPDGNQLPQFTQVYNGITRLCRAVAGAHLKEHEMRQLLTQRLLPKLSYALHGTSFTPRQCSKLDSVIRGAFLPGLRLNRHFPSAVLYGPTDFGGLEFPDIFTLQNQIQLDYLIKQLRWDKTVANDFLVTLDSVQLCSGLSSPILESTGLTIDYLDASYIIDLRRRLAEMGGGLWIESAWSPQLQREGDASLMECFSHIPGITRAKLRRANAVRLYLRVFSVADIADIPGTHIRDGMLQGDWQAGSDLLWPYQPKPPKVFWACFRWCLRQSVCRGEHPNQPPHYSMRLDAPLGRWLPVLRTTWHMAYRTESTIYWRKLNDQSLHILTPAPTSGFYHLSGITQDLPLHSHPIAFQQVGEALWSRSPLRLGRRSTCDDLSPGHMMENTLCHPTKETITIGSDGSVHLAEQVAACAWMIHDSDSKFAKACFLLSHISSLSSYRSELEGIFRSLKHVEHLGLTPSEIHQYCDNEAAVDKCQAHPWTPKSMIQPDADIILAIHNIRRVLRTKGTTVTCRHIYSHQDTRTPRTPVVFNDSTASHDPTHIIDLHRPSSTDNSSASDSHTDSASSVVPAPTPTGHATHHTKHFDTPTAINIECDRIATETSAEALRGNVGDDLPPTITHPLPGSRALLRIGSTWITSHTRRHILWEQRAHLLRTHCMNRFGWDNSTFTGISWPIIRAVRRRCTHTQRMQSSKIMFDWLPVMHMLSHMTGNSQCPGCTCTDETLDHLFICPHPMLVAKREEILAALRKKGLKRRLPRAFLDTLSYMMDEYFNEAPTKPCSHSLFRAASKTQRSIGVNMFLRGFPVTDWTTALHALGEEHPARIMAWTLRFMWFDCTDSLWRERNAILHHSQNQFTRLDSLRLDDKLNWFLTHRTQLARRDQYLLRFTQTDITNLPTKTKRELLRLLGLAHKIHQQELLLRENGQSVLTDFFSTNPRA